MILWSFDSFYYHDISIRVHTREPESDKTILSTSTWFSITCRALLDQEGCDVYGQSIIGLSTWASEKFWDPVNQSGPV